MGLTVPSCYGGYRRTVVSERGCAACSVGIECRQMTADKKKRPQCYGYYCLLGVVERGCVCCMFSRDCEDATVDRDKRPQCYGHYHPNNAAENCCHDCPHIDGCGDSVATYGPDPPEAKAEVCPEHKTLLKSDLGESDPNGKQVNEPGAKMDAGKVDMTYLGYFPNALKAVAEVSQWAHDVKGYPRNGWATVPDGVNRYSAALIRHWLAEYGDRPGDRESGLLHAAHLAWNALARLELMLVKHKESGND